MPPAEVDLDCRHSVIEETHDIRLGIGSRSCCLWRVFLVDEVTFKGKDGG